MPCIKNPHLFEPKADGENQRRYTERTTVAMELCLTSCKVFSECLALSLIDPSIWGVIAGRVVSDPELLKKAEAEAARYEKKKRGVNAPKGQ
jgi:hypothetical protein